MLLNFRIDDNGLTCLNPAAAASMTSASYVKCHFDIKSKPWADVDSIIVVFKSATYTVVKHILLDSNGNCYMDPDVFRRGGTVQVTIFGDKYSEDGVIVTSHLTAVTDVIINDKIVLPVPTPSAYQISIAEMEKLNVEIRELIQSVEDALANGDFDGVGIASLSFTEEGNVSVILTDGTVITSEYSFKGEQGDPGNDAPYITSVTYGEDGTVVIAMSDGTTFESDYSMKGEKGETGNGISSIEFDEDNHLIIELDNGQSAESEPIEISITVHPFIIEFRKTATLDSETSGVDLDMAGYEYHASDVMFVFINGLMAIPDVDYTVLVEDSQATVGFTMENPVNEDIFIRILKPRIEFYPVVDSNDNSIITNDGDRIII